MSATLHAGGGASGKPQFIGRNFYLFGTKDESYLFIVDRSQLIKIQADSK